MDRWNFPNSNGLGIHGVSDGGIETFKGNLIGSLTREICQNSLDATDKTGIVRIEFVEQKVSKLNVPGFSDLKDFFNDGKKFWEQRKNKKAINFFEEGIRVLSSNNISVLRISDYFTKGLTGSDKPMDGTPWGSMVFSEGVSNKDGTDGGSYGIGKSSVYASSILQTVFFNTYDINDVRAAQGVSKLPSFNHNNENKYGIGYYGLLTESGLTVCSEMINEIDNIYHRNQHGTDIFVMGFRNTSTWKDDIIKSLLDNFLLAICNGQLEVLVQDKLVNKETVEEYLKKYINDEKVASAYMYYNVLTSKETKTISENLFEDLGGLVELKVLITDEIANRTILMSRSNGMKLFDKNRISGSIQFSGILTLNGKKLNEYFSVMENPAHDNWEPDRYSNEIKIKEAKNRLTKLYRWAKDNVTKLGAESYGDEVEIKGLDSILPEFYDMSSKNKNEAITDYVKEVIPGERKKSKPTIDFKTFDNGDTLYEYEDTGKLDPNGEYDSKDVPHNPESDGDGGAGAPGKATLGEGNRPITTTKAVNNFKKRIFVSNSQNNEYTIMLTVNQNIIDTKLQVFISGESTTINADISNATMNGKTLRCSGNTIYIGNMYKNFSTKIVFNVDVDYQCNLEVKLYANKK